jgi:septum formation protein
MEIVLASASPRRHELLAQLGVRFEVLDADIDESRMPGEDPDVYAERLARAKAVAGWRLAGGERPTLGADTIVVLDEDILLKPRSRDEAARMLRRLSGRTHRVISAVALAMDPDTVNSRINRTRVTFADLPEPWIADYCAGDEPMDKAGAYAVQGLAARWIRHIDGSFSGVMGLPLFETAALLADAGLLD